ncbi:hypothetical protein GCM10017673_31760 [Streptosporangium violaceochromogenes]|nr:hypothetical protein GCM10017673_31760 [Streptosporangium violaceochromogenes]
MCTACACGTETAGAGEAGEPATTEITIEPATGPVVETVVETTAETTAYLVGGMTCGHCVSSVSGEIGKVGGVTGVAVDLSSGAVTVSGSGFTDEEIHAAVKRAGYEPAGRA